MSSYWSDEAVAARAKEQEELRLQWKFRGITTSSLEMRLENMAMSKQSQKDVEQELVRRGATYIKRSYYDRPTTVFGSDGGSVSFSSGADKSGYDWARIVEAEAAYLDEVMAKPLRLPQQHEVKDWLNNTVVRRVVPGLISMDELVGVQPMALNTSALPMIQSMKKLLNSNNSIEELIAADKDLQQVRPSWFDSQKIGRGLREPLNSGINILDYPSMLTSTTAATSVPKTNVSFTALTKMQKEIDKYFDDMANHNIRFLDYEAPSFFHHIVPKEPYVCDRDVEFMYQHQIRPIDIKVDIMNDDIKSYYPPDDSLFKINRCSEVVSSRPPEPCTEITSLGDMPTDWFKEWMAALGPLKSSYYTHSKAAVVKATAPVQPADYGMVCAGIEPERYKREDFFVVTSPTYKEKGEMTFTVTKERPTAGTRTVFDVANFAKMAEWAKADEPQTDHSEALAILGINQGDKQ